VSVQPIPVVGSISSYRLSTTLTYDNQDVQHVFELRWNSRDAAWYVNVLEVDDTPIVLGVKVVLGAFLGRRSTHPLFTFGVLVAFDLSGQDLDAGFDDFGTRVSLRYIPVPDLIMNAAGAT
jgi:hypothetical protein